MSKQSPSTSRSISFYIDDSDCLDSAFKKLDHITSCVNMDDCKSLGSKDIELASIDHDSITYDQPATTSDSETVDTVETLKLQQSLESSVRGSLQSLRESAVRKLCEVPMRRSASQYSRHSITSSTYNSARRRKTYSMTVDYESVTSSVLEDIHSEKLSDIRLCKNCAFLLSRHSLSRFGPSITQNSMFYALSYNSDMCELLQGTNALKQVEINKKLIRLLCTINCDQRFQLVKRYSGNTGSNLKEDLNLFLKKNKFSSLYRKVINYLLLRTEEYDAFVMDDFVNGKVPDSVVIDLLSFRTNMQIELMKCQYQRIKGKSLYQALKKKLKRFGHFENISFIKHLLLAQRDETTFVNERLAQSDAALLLLSLENKAKFPFWTVLGDRNFDQIKHTLLIFEKIHPKALNLQIAIASKYHGNMFSKFQKRHIYSIINYAQNPAKYFSFKVYEMGCILSNKKPSKSVFEQLIWLVVTRSEIDLRLIGEFNIFVDPRDKQAKNVHQWMQQFTWDFKSILLELIKGNREFSIDFGNTVEII